MEWVKSLVGYYRLLVIATGTDEMEVMFKRADALAGEIGSDGFIPDAMLTTLTRRPARAKKIAEQLVDAKLWVRVPGGYVIVDWATINAELVRLQARKDRDRERKRADRAASRGAVSADLSTDASADSPTDSLYESESKTQKKKAAAATRDGAGTGPDLPEAVEILRSALEAHKLTVRWDTLTVDELTEIVRLVEVHGDGPLVKDALRAFQPNKPPVYAKAWLRGWQQLRAPGDLQAVPDAPCTEPGHSGTTRHCVQCASEALATPKENR